MNIETISHLSGSKLAAWRNLIASAGLTAVDCAPRTVLLFDGEELVATGGRDGGLLKLIAVASDRRGEDLTASVLSALRRDAFAEGYTHLFLYTKPQNRHLFESLFFYPVVESAEVLLMENREGGLARYLDTLPQVTPGQIGATVMNCNPFTLGHQYLIECAAAACDRVFVFVLAEDKSDFSAADRLEMVRRGTAHLANVTVLSTGPYLISAATFPTYFLKDREHAASAACEVDVEIFVQHFKPRLAITRRYVGTEPTSRLTAAYNEALRARLPQAGIEVCEIARAEQNGVPISASTARALIQKRDVAALSGLLPATTLEFLREKEMI